MAGDDSSPPPPPPDDSSPPPPPGLNDYEAEVLGVIMMAVDEEISICDPISSLSRSERQDISIEVLDRVFKVMSEEGRSELLEEDRGYIKKRVRILANNCLPAAELRFAKLDRVVCNIGGERGWAPGTIQSLNEEDPSDPSGQTLLAYVVKIDPPNSRLVSVPRDDNDCARAEVCFGQRAGAIWFTRMCLPKAVRKGAQRGQRRFREGDRVACAVEDASNDYTNWAAGTVMALDQLVEDSDGVPGGLVPYKVQLDSGPIVLVHADEHWLVRDLVLQPAGPRVAKDGTRCLQRMSKRKTDDGWEGVDHMCGRLP